ncbi:DUF4976 domain-containing protein [Acidaminobacter sp. JC074]|uniref:sulfatase-like hydrolase/transferase n=1 Tax=Acidaminobacter sp. JC074 TaxID=2530199 RepID=UPI001F0D849F|nr:sulfatase-like hydrolase/transferase [Acidaminobacter sp. JC074]MCH4886191.1 DUF4976 domain-containing protein [Acidaminobacter sp. JC074]
MKRKQCILIMTDTQRHDMIGGQHTPNLNRLASQGKVFKKAYTTQPVCGPARSAIFTGTYPHTNGMTSNSMSLNQLSNTLGDYLYNRDIASGYIGKWHLDGGDYFGNGICPQGYMPDYWYDMRNYLDDLSKEDRIKSRQFETVLAGVDESFTFGHRCSNYALDFIEKHKDKEFMLVVSYDEPHDPYIMPKSFYELDHTIDHNLDELSDLSPDHIKLWSDKSKSFYKTTSLTEEAKRLYACNSYVDYEIGRVLEAIETSAPDALIIYTSDHGDALGDHGIHSKGPAMYDSITKIPFIIKWQDNIQTGSSDRLISHIDILPTCLDYFDLNIPSHLEGRSLLNTLDDQPEDQDAVFMEFTRYEIDHDGFGGFQPIRCIRDNRYKLIINLLTLDELYDLNTDPHEKINLIHSESHADTRNQLHQKLLNWMNQTRDPYRGYYWEQRPWNKDFIPTWDYSGMTRQRPTGDDQPRQLDYATGLEIKELVRRK